MSDDWGLVDYGFLEHRDMSYYVHHERQIKNLREAVIEYNYKFPEDCKLSGVIFYKGQKIYQNEFNNMARKMK